MLEKRMDCSVFWALIFNIFIWAHETQLDSYPVSLWLLSGPEDEMPHKSVYRGILEYSLDSHAESPGSNLTIAAAL